MARKNRTYDFDEDNSVEFAETFDSNNNPLNNGDSVVLTQDLKIKGSPKGFKRGDKVKNIKLTQDPDYIDIKLGKSTIALKTCYVKKK